MPSNPSSAGGRFGTARRGWRREGADSPETPGPRPGVPNMSVPNPRKAPWCTQRGGRGRIQKLSHMPFHSPHHPLLVPGTLPSPLLRCIWPCPGRTEACGGARAAGVTYLLGKFPAPRRDSPPPGLGLRVRPARRSAAASPPASEAAAAAAAATAKAAIPPVPPPRTAHTRASLAARIPALARVPEGTFLSRAGPGRASRTPPRPGLPRLPGPVESRRSNFPRGSGPAPPCSVSPGQVPSFPQGG